MKYVLLISWLVSVNLGVPLLRSVEDHYWRDFNGIISSDAISGGVNENGDGLYIAQAVVYYSNSDKELLFDKLPAVISRGSKTAIAAYNNKVVNITDEARIKVMCTSRAHYYSWLISNGILAPLCRFVVTGLQDGSALYVGRAIANNETVIGKVFADYRYTTLIALTMASQLIFLLTKY